MPRRLILIDAAPRSKDVIFSGDAEVRLTSLADIVEHYDGRMPDPIASRAEFHAFVELAEAGRFRAAIDVFPVEPVPADDPVRQTRNILLSSHLAGGTRDGYRRIRELLLDEIPHILKGLPARPLQHTEPRPAALQRSH